VTSPKRRRASQSPRAATISSVVRATKFHHIRTVSPKGAPAEQQRPGRPRPGHEQELAASAAEVVERVGGKSLAVELQVMSVFPRGRHGQERVVCGELAHVRACDLIDSEPPAAYSLSSP
jgi:hypothetical protein